MTPTNPIRQSGISLLLALILAACGGGNTPAPVGGIEGQVLIGPMCPVVQVGTPCPDQPYQATITVLDANGNQVAQFRSDAQGQFHVSLVLGTYTLRPESPDHFTRAGEQTVTVSAGQFTQVMIIYDNGIR
ncbi:MAG: carboxypeptidase regulatory-like domain-containing protein [Chloroflexi bacterium]|nr:carboxypeptidase regulatory-like domain-containing protein [Chloroflexota bacterium]